jgi:hypothetical protein
MPSRAARSAQSVASSLRRLRSTFDAEPRTASLSVCVHCERDFVVPVRWEPVGTDRWWMFLRCAECGVSREVTVSDAAAAAYDDELARGARAVAHAAHQLDLQRMTEEAAAFTDAMRRGLVEAADFGR